MKLARPDTSFDIKESFKEVFETVKEAQEVSEDDQIIAGKKKTIDMCSFYFDPRESFAEFRQISMANLNHLDGSRDPG